VRSSAVQRKSIFLAGEAGMGSSVEVKFLHPSNRFSMAAPTAANPGIPFDFGFGGGISIRIPEEFLSSFSLLQPASRKAAPEICVFPSIGFGPGTFGIQGQLDLSRLS